MPPFRMGPQNDESDTWGNDKDFAADLHEWMSLVALGSPRVLLADAIDTYLSRYRVPDPARSPQDQSQSIASNLVCLRYHGFLPSSIMMGILLATRRACREQWAAMMMNDFEGSDVDIMIAPRSGYYLEWATKDRPKLFETQGLRGKPVFQASESPPVC